MYRRHFQSFALLLIIAIGELRVVHSSRQRYLRSTSENENSHEKELEVDENNIYVAIDLDEAMYLLGTKEISGYTIYHGIGQSFLLMKRTEAELRLGVDRKGVVEMTQEETLMKPNRFEANNITRRHLRTYRGNDHGDEENDEGEVDGIFIAGDVTSYNVQELNYLLRHHDNVAFTKRYRSKTRLIVTELCTIKKQRKSEAGAYYCVKGKTVCVARQSMNRFYDKDTGGGVCGTLPLDDGVVNELPDYMQQAYKNTCDGDQCDGAR